MMTDVSIEGRLLASSAFASLSAEQCVHKVLSGYGWRTLHGTFYRDPDSGKVRELDVTARLLWQRGRRDRPTSATLDLLVEVKAARDFHILFTPIPPRDVAPYRQRVWIGAQGAVRKRLLRDLSRYLNPAQLTEVAERMDDIAYPRHLAVTRGISIDPPPLKWESTSFRETNIGGEKDLENSVLWRAGQALRSAFRSYRKLEYWNAFDWIRSDLEFDVTAKDDPCKSVLGNFAWLVRSEAQFHPIVVIDANLWMTSDTGVSRIPWCRFSQVDRSGRSLWWWDVVSSASFESYAALISEEYHARLKKRRARVYA